MSHYILNFCYGHVFIYPRKEVLQSDYKKYSISPLPFLPTSCPIHIFQDSVVVPPPLKR